VSRQVERDLLRMRMRMPTLTTTTTLIKAPARRANAGRRTTTDGAGCPWAAGAVALYRG